MLGECSILDAFLVFGVLEIKDLLHFQTPTPMSTRAGGEEMVVAGREILKT